MKGGGFNRSTYDKGMVYDKIGEVLNEDRYLNHKIN